MNTTLARPKPLVILAALAAHDIISQLTTRQLQVMGFLAVSAEPVPVGRVAEAVDTLSSGVSRASDKLFDLGLIERGHSPDDRRLILLSLTRSGRRVYETVERIFDTGSAA